MRLLSNFSNSCILKVLLLADIDPGFSSDTKAQFYLLKDKLEKQQME